MYQTRFDLRQGLICIIEVGIGIGIGIGIGAIVRGIDYTIPLILFSLFSNFYF